MQIMEDARSMFNASRLDNRMCAEVVNTTTYLINRSPIVLLDGKIPGEVWSSKLILIILIYIFVVVMHFPMCLKKKGPILT